jgi:hypothetical protein
MKKLVAIFCLVSISLSAAFAADLQVKVISVSGTGTDVIADTCALIATYPSGEKRGFAGAFVMASDGATLSLGMDGTPDSTVFYNLQSFGPLKVGSSLSGENGKFEIQSIDASTITGKLKHSGHSSVVCDTVVTLKIVK